MENEMGYTLAPGPEGLDEALTAFLERSKVDPVWRAIPHYILYEMGNQKALIRVDMSQRPFKFWHYDLLGRPASTTIKEGIARFLWEKCGGKEDQYYRQKTPEENQAKE